MLALLAYLMLAFLLEVATMQKDDFQPTGLKLLINKCRKNFRIPENLDHYSAEDLRDAEKKYVKYCLNGGGYLKSID
jgi:hypothetical protein